MLIVIGFDFKRIVSVSDVVTMSFGAKDSIKERVEKPMEDEQHFQLLIEMDLLVPNQSHLVTCQPGDPDKDKKGESGVVVENSFTCVDFKRKHIRSNRFDKRKVPCSYLTGRCSFISYSEADHHQIYRNGEDVRNDDGNIISHESVDDPQC